MALHWSYADAFHVDAKGCPRCPNSHIGNTGQAVYFDTLGVRLTGCIVATSQLNGKLASQSPNLKKSIIMKTNLQHPANLCFCVPFGSAH